MDINLFEDKKTYKQIILSLDTLYDNLKKTKELGQDYILEVFNELENAKKDMMLLYYIDLPVNYISYISVSGKTHLLLNRGERENMVNIMFSKYSRCKKYITTSLQGTSMWNIVRHKLPKDLGKDLKDYLSSGKSLIFYNKDVRNYYQSRIVMMLETNKDDVLSTYGFINELLIFIPLIQNRDILYSDFERFLKEKVGDISIKDVLDDAYYRLTNDIKWENLDKKFLEWVKYLYYSVSSDNRFFIKFFYPTKEDNIAVEAFNLNKKIYELICSKF